MPIEIRQASNKERPLGNGPFLAKVVGHLDPSFMGGLEVSLIRNYPNDFADDNQVYQVKCATPFYGTTGLQYTGTNIGNDRAFDDTQKSYGMWFVPPDVGVTVLVVFIDGNPADGYWIACVPDRFVNNMVPAIASSEFVDLSPEQKSKYKVKKLPVAEINKRANDLSRSSDIDKVKRPVHPIADALLAQGLLEDEVRGITTSSARRSVPNSVFGISTPGPIDRRPGAKQGFIGKRETKSVPVFVSRLGGTQFVMDDGDDSLLRTSQPSDGPSTYSPTGDPNYPASEYFRVRTRTGHQILLHNSEDLIYIGNSRGTTWIELTSNGKIDIYAQDSVSIHTEQDLNLKADRDVNIDAGRNINMRSGSNMKTEVGADHSLIVTDNSTVDIGVNYNTNVGKEANLTTKGEYNLNSTGALRINARGNLSIKSNADLLLEANANTNIKSGGKHIEYATKIEMNCDPASPAEVAKSAQSTTGFSNDVVSREPMHEPWSGHENLNPAAVTPEATDKEK